MPKASQLDPAFVLLHGVHAVLVLAGAVVVVALLWPARRAARHRLPGSDPQLAELRRACAEGTLITVAEARAAELLHGGMLPSAPPRNRLLVTASVTTVLAAGLHAAVSPEHYTEGLRFGVFFTVLSIAQVGTAIALLTGPAARLLAVTATGNAVVIGLWLLTRTVGLPFGLAEVESVGLPDTLCSVAEAVAGICCALVLRRMRARPPAGLVPALSAPGGR